MIILLGEKTAVMRFSPIKATGTTSRRPFCPAFSKAGEKFPEGNAQKAALPPENACKASGIHALCVQVGAAPRHPGKCREAANDCCESNKNLIWFVRYCHCGVLIRGLRNLESFPKGKRIVTFCGVQKVTQKARGVPPCDPGSNRRSKRCFG